MDLKIVSTDRTSKRRIFRGHDHTILFEIFNEVLEINIMIILSKL
jgi:hypothetical protein